MYWMSVLNSSVLKIQSQGNKEPKEKPVFLLAFLPTSLWRNKLFGCGSCTPPTTYRPHHSLIAQP